MISQKRYGTLNYHKFEELPRAFKADFLFVFAFYQIYDQILRK